jgi:hypothetical protein
MTEGDLARLRAVPLADVLTRLGAVRDPRDRSRWKTPRGSVSVTGMRFFNWREQTGGGGAIDLAMHLGRMDFRAAIAWLRAAFGRGGTGASAEPHPPQTAPPESAGMVFEPPARHDGHLAGIVRYLEDERAIPPAVLRPLLAAGVVYADGRANAVFLHTDRRMRPVGAELRGTAGPKWRGMAAGSRKAAGYFAAGPVVCSEVVLCEAAIDAMSCHALRPAARAISTAGVCPEPAWLAGLLAEGRPVSCGFDTDEAGESAARAMIERHPAVRRLRPAAHDWNDELTARRAALVRP